MKRRTFIKAAAALPAAGLAEGITIQAEARNQTTKPNILFVLVDEMRFPSVFPTGVKSASEFLKKYMPNTYRLWQGGVKFANHFTAATACTPSRGVLITGLYSQQSWLAATITARPFTNLSVAPVLNKNFPTYGKLLKKAGYKTPYIGKWHASIPSNKSSRLSEYGFQGLTYYDPTGANLQGAVGDVANGYMSDGDIANQAVDWLTDISSTSSPWCLTVSFINPHDHEFFWAGTEFDKYNPLFTGTGYKPFLYNSYYNGTFYPPVVSPSENTLSSPPSYGYPTLPPNWESSSQIATKPSLQTFARAFQGAVWGAVSDDSSQQQFSVSPYPNPKQSATLAQLGIGVAPYTYWQRGLDNYTLAMTMVDKHIGTVLDAIPSDVASNTIIVFTSDHGDYAGAHGFISGKIGSVYDEPFHIPLIVHDSTGLFAAETQTVRTGLTSSVDVMGMLVSLGYSGTRDWITAELTKPYASRLDMIAILKSSTAPGRPYVLLVSDEQVPDVYNYNDSPPHIIGVRTATGKLGIYADWTKETTDINPATIETEYYDYSTSRGRLELDSTPDSAGAVALKQQLFSSIIPNELHAPLGKSMQAAQIQSKREYVLYIAIRNFLNRDQLPFREY